MRERKCFCEQMQNFIYIAFANFICNFNAVLLRTNVNVLWVKAKLLTNISVLFQKYCIPQQNSGFTHKTFAFVRKSTALHLRSVSKTAMFSHHWNNFSSYLRIFPSLKFCKWTQNISGEGKSFVRECISIVIFFFLLSHFIFHHHVSLNG